MEHKDILSIFVGKRSFVCLKPMCLSINYSPKNNTRRMKKLFKGYRLLVLTVFSGSLLLLGCTNADYDFDKVDTTLGFGDGQLTLPSNNSVVVTLDDILDLGSTDLIKVEEATGDYVFGKDPESVSPVTVNIDPITNTGFTTNLPIPALVLDPVVSAFAGQVIKLSDYGVEPLKVKQSISTFDYSFTVPDEVKELNQLTLQEGGSDLNITLTLPGIKSVQKFVITLPKQLVLVNKGIGTLSADNTLTLPAGTPVENNKLEFKFKVTDIKANLNANHQLTLQDNVNLDVEVDEIVVPSSSTIQFAGQVTLSQLTVTAATGVFKPTIDAQQVGSTTINSLPNFLTDARVVADVDNPQIWLTVESNLPISGTVEARLGSSTLNGFVELTKAKGNALHIAANTTTRLVICRKAPGSLSGYTAIIADDLSNVIKKLNEGMQITIDITSFEADESTSTILLGHDYTFTPNYRFTAPLALGDEAVIVYTENEGDWSKDIDKLQLSKGSKAILTANVENSVPADLQIDITPQDKNGQTLSELVVTPIKNKVAAGVNNGQIEYEITDPNGNGLKQLDGIHYILNATAPSTADQKSKTLNKNQKILLKDIKLQLNGHVVVDAN